MTRPDEDNKENEPLVLTVDEEVQGQRLDKWLSDQLTDFSRSRLKALIEEGHLMRDGSPVSSVSTKTKAGEVYCLILPDLSEPTPEPENIPLEILFEDDHLIVLNKPAGMVVHPAAGNYTGTLVNALLHHCQGSLSGIGGVARPGIVHRLDKDTSGVMVAAKHDKAHKGLTAAFSVHDIKRVYMAIVHGAPRPGVGTVETGYGRAGNDRKKMAVHDLWENPDAKEAITHDRIRETYGQGRAKMPGDSLASLVDCELETGRTHQIRVHMAHLGHPLLGDPLYGRGPGLSGLRPGEDVTDLAIKVLGDFRRQALHARELGFIHPVTGEKLSFDVSAPADFTDLMSALQAL